MNDANLTQPVECTLWIKAADIKMFDPQERCAVAWRLDFTDSRRPIQHVSKGPDFPPRPIIRALIVEVTDIVRSQMPRGCHMRLVSDLENLWKAFHPDHNWLQRWIDGGFRKKPEHQKDEWRSLADALNKTGVMIRGNKPVNTDESTKLERLGRLAHRAADPNGVAPEWDDETEQRYQHLITKDD